MRKEIENPMVIDAIWRNYEKEPAIVGECAGCLEDIYEGENILVFDDVHGETVMVHQDSECTYQYVSGMAYCKVAGE